MSHSLAIWILSYNHPDITRRCLIKTLSLTAPTDFSLGLVHNGSEERWVQQLQTEFPQIDHYILRENQGYSGGVNAALHRGFAKAPWVLLLTNDCEILQLTWPKDLPAGLYGPSMILRKKNLGTTYGGFFIPDRGQIGHVRQKDSWNSLISSEKTSRLLPYIPGHAFILNYEVWAQTGGFDKTLHTYWEDVDYSQRVLQKNFPLQVLEDFQILHHGGKTNRKKPLYTLYFYQRNRCRVSMKYTPASRKILLLCFLFWNFARQLQNLLRQKRIKDLSLLYYACKDGLWPKKTSIKLTDEKSSY